MIFDSHAHYEDERFGPDRNELLSAMRSSNIGRIINVGSTLNTSKASIELSNQYEDIYAAVGIHPSEVAFPIDGDEENALSVDESLKLMPKIISELEALSFHDKCVSIGEIGLDYYWDKEEDNHNLQKVWFEGQLELAATVNKPVIIHSREANQDTFDIMADAKKRLNTSAVIHCYSGSAMMATEYVKLGYYIGVGGVVTFKNGRRLRESVEAVPLENILLETDAPYLAPEPYRGKRNDSTRLQLIVEKIAALKNVSRKEVEEVTWDNAMRFYKMG